MKTMFDVRKLFGAGMFLLSVLALSACAGGANPVLPTGGGTPVGPSVSATPVLPATGDTPVVPATSAAPVEVQLKEYTISMPSSLPAGHTVFKVSNLGTTTHGFQIEGPGVNSGLEQNLAPGETASLEVDLAAGTYQVYCPVDAHRGRGMQVELTVTAP